MHKVQFYYKSDILDDIISTVSSSLIISLFFSSI